MITYDFYITSAWRTHGKHAMNVRKMASTDARQLLALDVSLDIYGVDDKEIGQAIEKLEALPYGAAQVTVTGTHGKITINQEIK